MTHKSHVSLVDVFIDPMFLGSKMTATCVCVLDEPIASNGR